jgi:hypothetical protein
LGKPAFFLSSNHPTKGKLNLRPAKTYRPDSKSAAPGRNVFPLDQESIEEISIIEGGPVSLYAEKT